MMPYFNRVTRRGLGANSGQTILAGSSALATAAVPLLGLGPVGVAIDAGIAAVSVAINAIMNSGCGQTCIVSTQFANQAENLMKQNIAAYFSTPAPRSPADQAAALANFDGFWAWLTAAQQCGNPALGTAGRNCIGDREAGACKWTVTTPNLWPGQPGPGQCFNWFSGYRDPIANDPNVSASVSAASVSSLASSNVGGIPLWMLAGAALGGFLLWEAL